MQSLVKIYNYCNIYVGTRQDGNLKFPMLLFSSLEAFVVSCQMFVSGLGSSHHRPAPHRHMNSWSLVPGTVALSPTILDLANPTIARLRISQLPSTGGFCAMSSPVPVRWNSSIQSHEWCRNSVRNLCCVRRRDIRPLPWEGGPAPRPSVTLNLIAADYLFGRVRWGVLA